MLDSESCLIKLIVVIVIVFLFLWYIYASTNPVNNNRNNKLEKFDNCCDVKFKKQNYKKKNNLLPTIYSPLHVADTNSNVPAIDFIPQDQYLSPQNELINVKTSKNDKLEYCNDPKGIGDNGLNFNFCSPACCSNQYPVPFNLSIGKSLYYSNDKYVPTSYMCNDGVNGSGCLCLKKSQANFMNSRGLNAYS